jgi:ribonuclease P protein component
MFPSHARLRQNNDVQGVLHNGTYLSAGPIGARFLECDQDNATIAVVVGKKTLPRAVDRNRAKRRLAEAIREQYALLPQSTRSVFFYRTRSPLEISVQQLRRSVRMILEQVSRQSRGGL